jgi:hypothetical protein
MLSKPPNVRIEDLYIIVIGHTNTGEFHVSCTQ